MKNLDVKTGYVGSVEISQVRKGNQLVLAPNGDKLWYDSNELPSLDLRFADNKSLTDAVTGQSLITFNRNSRGGTYVGSDGLIKTAVTNLLLQSEDFSTTWTPGTNTTITTNYGTAPNGTMTADRVQMTSDAGTFVTQSVNVVSGVLYSLSVYARATSGTSKIALQQGGSNIQIWTIGTTWQRLSVQFTAISTGATTVGFDNDDSVCDFLLWGAQLEESSTVGEYVPTTSAINSAPRFDHNPTTGESLGLLVEESRTNLLLRSEEFDTTWTTLGLLGFGSGSVANATTAPNGTATADLITENTSNSEHIIAQSVYSAAVSTFSIYVKPNGRTWIFFQATMTGGSVPVLADRRAWINLSTKTAGTIGSTWSNIAITDVGDGWLRVSGVSNPLASGSAISIINVGMTTADNTVAYTGDGTSGIYIWGAQLEAGAFPTSYIPTSTSTVTRNADVAKIDGTAFSRWYNQSEGTMFTSFNLNANRSYTGTFRHLLQITPTANNNSAVGVLVDSLNRYQLQVRDNNSNVATPLTGINTGETSLVAAVYKVDDFAITANGGSPATDNSGAAPTTDPPEQMTIGQVRDANVLGHLNGTIRRLCYWGQRLPNSTLQNITQ